MTFLIGNCSASDAREPEWPLGLEVLMAGNRRRAGQRAAIPWKGRSKLVPPETVLMLNSLASTYKRVRPSRTRDAIYEYLREVYGNVRDLSAGERTKMAADLRALRQSAVHSDNDLLATLIQLTSDADRRVRDRWLGALRK